MEDLRRIRSEIQRGAAVSSLSSDDFFTDIFGGAPLPRSIFSHQISAAGGFYDNIFWSTKKASPPQLRRRGRNLPLFDIPSLQQNQKSRPFRDIFGLDAKKKKKKSYSESGQTSNELEYDDVAMSAAKLRCILVLNNYTKSYFIGYNRGCCSVGIEEKINVEQMKLRRKAEIMDEEMEIDEDEFIELDSRSASSYVPSDVDEAIAWANQKFNSHSKPTFGVMNESPISSRWVEDSSLEKEDDGSIVDEKMRLWLSGKESDIRLLLSSLHQILWPNSGWMAIPLAKLMESSQVKKAYQKSVLCLHPDKLQQRGASLLHKYIARKVFAALQDAWTTFTSLDVSCR
ncbi:hypothetical protein SASPL_155682 [Salvia splendens]|uniref:Cyclin G-associated kinase n=1 Tax=Salvia splendens TaxID=180675 RepID=A0A8X8VY23_SALSN|nr:hypothetical protein SASPL_155682 [Salvia splendens]